MNFGISFGAVLGTLLFSGQAFATIAAPAHYTSPLTCTRNFYVSPSGSDTANCGAGPMGTAANCATPWGADAASSIGNTGTTLAGGDCVNVQGTTPTETLLGSSGWTAYLHSGQISFNRSGTSNQANGYVNYVCSVNHGCYIGLNGSIGTDMIRLNDYQAFDGFEMDGHNIQGYNGYNANNTNTYWVGDGAVVGTNGNHHLFLNNIMHGAGASAGGGTVSNDYEYYLANEQYDGAGTNCYHTSVNDNYERTAIPGFTATLPWDTNSYHIQFIGNVIHDGGETAAEPAISCGGQQPVHTDGDGIIIDDFQLTQRNPPGPAYPYKVFAAHNLIYNIGGRGVLVYTSANTTWVNNTIWNACFDPQVTSSRGCQEYNLGGWDQNGTASIFINNIGYRQTSGSNGALSISGGDANNITNNLTYDVVSGGTSYSGVALPGGSNPLLGVNPNLANPSAHDFHPLAGSPALGAGTTQVTTQFALKTPDGQNPPSTPNVGAFNVSGGPPPPPPVVGVSGPV
jgi:hypothetical protein